MKFRWMVKSSLAHSAEGTAVRALAETLHSEIDYQGISETIAGGQPGSVGGRVTSHRVQAHVALAAEPLGFRSERRGIFRDMNLQLRPDLFHAGLEVLLEVERGGANTNNHDLKDFWKCHLCPTAQWLFLVLPERVHGGQPFHTTGRRFTQFFEPGNEVNVSGVALFGY